MNRDLERYPMSGTTQDAIDHLRTLDAIACEFERVNERDPSDLAECVADLLRAAGYRTVPKADRAEMARAASLATLDAMGWDPVRAAVGEMTAGLARRRDELALGNARAEAGLAAAFDGVTDIVERNAKGWQDGEETAARR